MDELKNYLKVTTVNSLPEMYWSDRKESFDSNSAAAPAATGTSGATE